MKVQHILDNTGTVVVEYTYVGATVAASASVFEQTVIEDKSFSEVNWGDVGVEAFAGAVTSVLPGSGVMSSAGKALAGSLITNVGNSLVSEKEFSAYDIFSDAVSNFMFGMASEKLGTKINRFIDKKIPYFNLNEMLLPSLLGNNTMKNSGAQVYRVFSKAEKKNKFFKANLDAAKDLGVEIVQQLID